MEELNLTQALVMATLRDLTGERNASTVQSECFRLHREPLTRNAIYRALRTLRERGLVNGANRPTARGVSAMKALREVLSA